MIQVYTGCGKGKTTAAIGLAVRAAGAGLNVYIAQFTKGRKCSELKSLKRLKNIKVEQFGACHFIRKITPKDITHAQRGLAAVKKIIRAKNHDVIILDEINVALELGLIAIKDVVEIMKKIPSQTELVLTGRNAPDEVLHYADLISEINEVKHYFKIGIKARKGIEF